MTTAPPMLEQPPRSTDSLDDTAFTLDITVIEQGDYGGLVRLTEDGCGSTCGACTTG